MFKRLLVPLDGSSLAESVLPTVVYLAQTIGASVTLIHVIERNAPPEIHGERHLTNSADACTYLASVTDQVFPAEVKVEQHVHSSEVKDVARTITEHVDEFESDLIVMCTHGRGGLRDWLFGSIAQQVIALGPTPILTNMRRRSTAGTCWSRWMESQITSGACRLRLLWLWPASPSYTWLWLCQPCPLCPDNRRPRPGCCPALPPPCWI